MIPIWLIGVIGAAAAVATVAGGGGKGPTIDKVSAKKIKPARAKKSNGFILRAKKVGQDPITVSPENGWIAAKLESAKGATMEWGFCVWDLKKAQTQGGEESKAVKAIMSVIGWVVEYVISIVKAATLDVSFCAVVEIPAMRVEIDGYGVLYSPSKMKVGAGTNTMPGWSPISGRYGFSYTGVEELPEGKDLWIKNHGDLYGWGYDVYQVVAVQDGELRSFPMMKRAGWRRGLQLAGEGSPLGATEDGEWTPGVVPYFKENRASGQDYKWRPRTRVKAMNRFE